MHYKPPLSPLLKNLQKGDKLTAPEGHSVPLYITKNTQRDSTLSQKEKFMRTMAEKWTQEGLEKGILQGIVQGMEKGKKEGIEEGIEKGQVQALQAVALNLLDEGLPLHLIEKATGLSPEQVQNLKKPTYH
jgi:predicted transposase/invertase (TIGR01784 family)